MNIIVLQHIKIEDPGFIVNLCDLYPNRIILGVDSDNGFIKTKGWQQETSIRTIDLIRSYTNVPICIDTEGAQIRTRLKKKANLEEGEIINILST